MGPVSARESIIRLRHRIVGSSMCLAIAFQYALVIGTILSASAGCAHVNPQPDFERTTSGIRDRLAIDDVYDPTVEAQIEGKVGALLADGVTADEAVTIALLNNRGFQARFQSIGVSRADVVQSGLLTNPSLLIGARFPEGGGRSELTLGFAQQIVDLWQIPVKKKIAEAGLEQGVLTISNEAVRLAAQTRARYYDLLWRKQAEAVARENLSVAERSLLVAETRFNAGDVGPLDVGLVRTKSFEARSNVWLAERDCLNARLALAEILGLARYAGSWEVVDSPPASKRVMATDADLVILAGQNRFDVQVIRAALVSAEENLELKFLQIFPSLEIGLNAERTERRALPGRKILADSTYNSLSAGDVQPPTIESKGNRDLARRQIIDALMGPSIALTLPIWDQNQAQIARARFGVIEASKRQDELLDAVTIEVQRAAYDARIALMRYEFYESEVLPHVSANLDSARTRYENGEESVILLLETQEEVFNQRRIAIDALRDYRIALVELERAVGGKLPAPDDEVPAGDPSGTEPTEVEINGD